MVKSGRYPQFRLRDLYTYHHLLHLECMYFLSPQFATRQFSDMNTNPAPEHTWSLSSKEVKALSHASGSDYVYALTEDEVSEWDIYHTILLSLLSQATFIIIIYCMSSLVIAKMALTSAEMLHNRMGVIQLVCTDSTGLRLAWNIDRRDRQYRQYIQINTNKLSCQN